MRMVMSAYKHFNKIYVGLLTIICVVQGYYTVRLVDYAKRSAQFTHWVGAKLDCLSGCSIACKEEKAISERLMNDAHYQAKRYKDEGQAE